MAELPIEVAYAGPEGQAVVALVVPEGTTAWQAVERALPQLPAGVRPDEGRIGVFGKKVEAEQVLAAGDRVEIYRALTLDPMEARRRRAAR
ncbi:RnfH family protein [Luteibacter aegosomaticola]|uniref:RnfH family protein n=1 Tax=Luteibacter aegosomaticola TaxID=2911538 RepID=UPI001FF8F48F|nr:RnfH family protein [Luteibacter aegosomaticola]UPG88476.1 RnfH family protein [Luteibacter aegosomaticola]